jgi:TonB-dependent receptor
MRNLSILLGALLLCAFLPLSAQKGALTGSVYDDSGEILYGANVIIDGTSIGAQTDYIDGKYSFQAEPGVYTILASYIGYPDMRLEGVEIKANETTILDIILEENGGVQLEEVVVAGQRLERSENAVLMLRKKADKVQDIISSQEISRLGASNASSALQKVTGTTIVDGKYVYVRGLGDRYSATTLNGLRLPSIDPYRNSAQLDLIPTSILDNITASKSFTPDLPGDFTGGSVNIKLKSLPERFTWSIGASVAYNEQNNLQENFLGYANPGINTLGFQDGSLDLPEILTSKAANDLGAFERSSARQARRDDELAGVLDEGIRAIPGTMQPVEMQSSIDHSISFSVGNQFELGQAKLGVFATGSYSRDFSQFQNGVNASYFASPGADELIAFFGMEEAQSEESPTVNGMLGMSFRPNSANSINAYAIYSHQTFLTGRRLIGDYDDYGVGGEGNFFSSETQAFMERELADYVLSGEHTLTKLNNVRINWSANYVDSKQLEPDLRFFAYAFDNDRYDINESLFTLPTRFWRDLNDDLYQGKLDITIPFLQQKATANSIKFGGTYSTKARDFDELQWIYGQRRELTLDEVDGDVSRYFGPENIGIIGGEPGSNEIGLYLIDNVLPANSYTGNIDIAAAYLMTTLEFGKLKAIAGVRGENTDILVESEVLNIVENPDSLTISMNSADIENFSVLPALNLVYSLNDNSNLRFSATQTLARPNMREVAPFGAFGAIGEPTVFGNPELTLTNITNLDLRWEVFPRSGEVLAVSAFYKTFTDPIVSTYRPAGNPQFTWVNVDEGELYGAEIEVRKDLDFLSPKMEDFNISANFAYINSSVSVDERECELSRDVDPDFDCSRQFAGQSPIVANANLSYTNPESNWDAVLAYNFFADRLASVGAVGTPDIFERGRGQLDFSLSKKIQNFKLTFRARNLLNPDYEQFSEFNGQTYVFRNFRRGVTYSFGASYSM